MFSRPGVILSKSASRCFMGIQFGQSIPMIHFDQSELYPGPASGPKSVASSCIERAISQTLSRVDIKSPNLPRPILPKKCVLIATSYICSLNALISFRICLSLCCCNSHFLYMSWHKSSAAEYLCHLSAIAQNIVQTSFN